jgi:hypothetical protein
MGTMTARTVVLNGVFQRVSLGSTSKVLGPGKYSMTGMARKTVEKSEFGDDVDVFEFSTADGGTISLTDVLFDPADEDQNTLRACVSNRTKLNFASTNNLRLWINSNSYYGVGTSGNILLTSAGAIESDRNGLAKTSFEGQVSGAFMHMLPI